MITKTNAIVLRRYTFRESSLILVLYTVAFGKLTVIAKGAKKLKSKKLSHFEIPNSISATIYYKEKRQMQLLSDSHVLDYYSSVKSDIKTYCYAQFALELVDALVEESYENETLFRLMKTYLDALQVGDADEMTLAFEIKLLRLLGIFPNFLECSVTGKKIDGPAGIVALDGGVISEAGLLYKPMFVKEWIYPEEVAYIFNLMKNTFPEIIKKSTSDMEIKKMKDKFDSYLEGVTHRQLKTTKIMKELI